MNPLGEEFDFTGIAIREAKNEPVALTTVWKGLVKG